MKTDEIYVWCVQNTQHGGKNEINGKKNFV